MSDVLSFGSGNSLLPGLGTGLKKYLYGTLTNFPTWKRVNIRREVGKQKISGVSKL